MPTIFDTATLREDQILSSNHASWIYNGLDSCVTLEILEELETHLDEVSRPMYQFALDKQAPVMEMSMRGLRIDTARKAQVMQGLASKIAQLEDLLSELILGIWDFRLNWRSPLQMNQFFYGVLGLPAVKKRNANGIYAPTTNREALEKLSIYFDAQIFCNIILCCRDFGKQLSFLQTTLDEDGRMRCSFNIAGTNTGRLSSSFSDMGTGTNLQNIDKTLREIFIPDPGMKFANIDLEQADARNVGAICWNLFYASHGAEFAGAYLDACESGDLHTTVCRMAWPELEWPADRNLWRTSADTEWYRGDSYRDGAKKLGHGSNYLGTPRTMANHTKTQTKIIEEFQRRYFAAFPVLLLWHANVVSQLKETRSITTLLGRRRYFFSRHTEGSTHREATAYEPQSLTAHEIDLAYMRIHSDPECQALGVQLLLQVHDSILIQYPAINEVRAIARCLELMSTIIILAGGRKFFVPAEAKVGWNWSDQQKGSNYHGLIKWKGSDERSGPAQITRRVRPWEK